MAAIYNGLVKKLIEENKDKYSNGPIVVIVCGGSAVSLDALKKWKIEFNL